MADLLALILDQEEPEVKQSHPWAETQYLYVFVFDVFGSVISCLPIVNHYLTHCSILPNLALWPRDIFCGGGGPPIT
jgi:hypothetical protein